MFTKWLKDTYVALYIRAVWAELARDQWISRFKETRSAQERCEDELERVRARAIAAETRDANAHKRCEGLEAELDLWHARAVAAETELHRLHSASSFTAGVIPDFALNRGQYETAREVRDMRNARDVSNGYNMTAANQQAAALDLLESGRALGPIVQVSDDEIKKECVENWRRRAVAAERQRDFYMSECIAWHENARKIALETELDHRLFMRLEFIAYEGERITELNRVMTLDNLLPKQEPEGVGFAGAED